MARRNLVAVYGSLRKGMGNHGLLTQYNANFVGEDVLDGWIMLGVGGFPAIIPSEPDERDKVRVEVYEISAVCEGVLDGLEGVEADFYERWTVSTKYGKALIYVWHPMTFHNFFKRHSEFLPVVAGGDWVAARCRPISWSAKNLIMRVDQVYLDRIEEILSTGVDPEDNVPGDDDEDDDVIEAEAETIAEVPPPAMVEFEYPLIRALEENTDADVSNPAF